MSAVEEMMYVVCECVTKGGDGCELSLCKHDLRKGDYLFCVGQGCNE